MGRVARRRCALCSADSITSAALYRERTTLLLIPDSERTPRDAARLQAIDAQLANIKAGVQERKCQAALRRVVLSPRVVLLERPSSTKKKVATSLTAVAAACLASPHNFDQDGASCIQALVDRPDPVVSESNSHAACAVVAAGGPEQVVVLESNIRLSVAAPSALRQRTTTTSTRQKIKK